MCFRNFANDRVVHGSFFKSTDTVTFSRLEVEYFFTLLKHLTRFVYTLIFNTSDVKMHEMLTSRLLIPSVMNESGHCDGLLIREARKTVTLV